MWVHTLFQLMKWCMAYSPLLHHVGWLRLTGHTVVQRYSTTTYIVVSVILHVGVWLLWKFKIASRGIAGRGAAITTPQNLELDICMPFDPALYVYHAEFLLSTLFIHSLCDHKALRRHINAALGDFFFTQHFYNCQPSSNQWQTKNTWNLLWQDFTTWFHHILPF